MRIHLLRHCFYQNKMMRNSDSPIKEVAGYHLAECIGSGGMGDVYKAYNSFFKQVCRG